MTDGNKDRHTYTRVSEERERKRERHDSYACGTVKTFATERIPGDTHMKRQDRELQREKER